MTELYLPWLQLAIGLAAIGALIVGRMHTASVARGWAAFFHALVLVATAGAWIDFALGTAPVASDPFNLPRQISSGDLMVIDSFSAPLLPLVALVYLFTTVTTLRTKLRRFSFAWALLSEALLLATFSCREPLAVAALLAASAVPPYLELKARGKSTRVYVLHMAAFAVLIGLGSLALVGVEPVRDGLGAAAGTTVQGALATHVESDAAATEANAAAVEATAVKTAGPSAVSLNTLPEQDGPPTWAVVALVLAIWIRGGLVPLHTWKTDLFEHATFGGSLLVASSLGGAYAAARLLLPNVPEWALSILGGASLFTAVYASGMALVQREARRFFAYLFLSNSALVLVGLETASAVGVAGALCVWISAVLALGGFGLTLRAVEARLGRLSLSEYHGLYDHMPTLAAFFLLTGLASVGFPGTLGFIGGEMLVDGAVQAYAYIGMAVVVAAAINGIAVVRAYFLLFTGRRHPATVSLRRRGRERFAVLVLAGLILGGGLFPQPGVISRFEAAVLLLAQRRSHIAPAETDAPHEHGETWWESHSGG